MRNIFDKKDKRGQVTSTIVGIIGLIFTVVIGYVLIDTLLGANLLTQGGTYDVSADNLSANLTDGIGEVALKLPTILLIVAVVFLFGALALLILQARRMGMFGSGGGF